MKIEVAAKNAEQAIDFARTELGIKGQIHLSRVGEGKEWHGDLLPVKADRGEPRHVYSIRVEPHDGLVDNGLYVL